ncbi:MAG: hypothetical protein J0I42_09685 [Bosea sp.]|uniref:hypothetical protein n=1 Tax=Bosea sp. (in: a-proteobacteria) TaxID=1871050 RepID=UPI001AC954F4|nr:hypothetical protein [Bosea sp. (in: a-proteobacteria)]MBN9452209.1 hypothetical protein [Bosea sp. (in: a-proteobacteria)]
MSLVIRNDVELLAAVDRAQELLGCVEGSAEQRELEEIAEAVEQYTQITLAQRHAANDHTRS